jgi:hypothetical protein
MSTVPGFREACLAVLILAGCAAPAAVGRPAVLPLRTLDQGFDIRWALVRDEGRVHAIGEVQSSTPLSAPVVLLLLGLDRERRVVSRASGTADPGFTAAPMPFSIVLVPTGAEERFVVQAWTHVPFGLRR